MNKIATNIIITALLLLSVFQFFDGCQARRELKEEKVKYTDGVNLWREDAIEKSKELAKMDSATDALKQDIADTVEHYQRIVATQTKAINRIRPTIKPVDVVMAANDTTVTRDQLMRRDTLIAHQDSVTSALYAENKAIKVSTGQLVEGLEVRAKLAEDEVSKWIGRWQESEAKRMEGEKQMRRQRRKERFVEAVIVGAVIAVSL